MTIFKNLAELIQKYRIDERLKSILPKKIFEWLGFIYTYSMFFLVWYGKLLQENEEIKNSKKWKRAFILATWPSINQEDLKNLKNEDCYSISNFFLHNDIDIINPKFHFFAPYHKPLLLEDYIAWLNQADDKLPKDTIIFLWHTTEKYVKKFNLFKNRKIKYLFLSPFAWRTNINISLPILSPATWPHMILPVLFYMWYSEIYLLGCDCNTLKTYWEDRNDFYERDKDIRRNAADKNSRKWSIINLLEWFVRMFKQYDMYKKIADQRWIKIINLSKDSWLDSFPKMNYKEIIEK